MILSFVGYLGEIESDSLNCFDLHTHYCATVSTSNFQVLIAWLTINLLSAFGLAQLVLTLSTVYYFGIHG